MSRFDSESRNQTPCSPRVQPDRVCCLNIVSIRIIGIDLTGRGSLAVNQQMIGSSPIVPAKQSVVIYLCWDRGWAVNPVSKTAWFDSDHDAPICDKSMSASLTAAEAGYGDRTIQLGVSQRQRAGFGNQRSRFQNSPP